MSASPANNHIKNTKSSILLFLSLTAAGLAGNYVRFPIFFNIDFLFGSIFAMLALLFFGTGRGILAAAIIAGYTYSIWNHPYAIIIMTAEVAFVGWLTKRRKIGIILADFLYWLFIGMPLAYLFYHIVMHVPPGNAYITMTKQAINGISNSVVAFLLFTGYTLLLRTSLIPYREIVYGLLAFFVIFPTLIMLAISSRSDFSEMDHQARASLLAESKQLNYRLETWLASRQSVIANLAEMAVSRSPKQLQPHLEQAMKSDASFRRVGLQNSAATTTAIFPLTDDLGKSCIGINYADRPYIPLLKQTLKPMLSEVVMRKTGTPAPMISILAPVVANGKYNGYVIGVLGFEKIKADFENLIVHAARYTLLDKNGNVIISNRSDQRIMSPFVREKGTIKRINSQTSQWMPALPHNTPLSESWKQSLYISETSIGDQAEWKLILEQPVAPFQKKIHDSYTGRLSLLFMILSGALLLAELLSRNSAVALDRLRTLTFELPARLESNAKELVWPESGIKETQHLINNFRQMAASLADKFSEISRINESLEQRIEERTGELQTACESLSNTNELFNLFLKHSPIYAFIKEVTSTESRVVQASENYQQMIGIPGSEMIGKTMAELFPPELAAKIIADDWRVVSTGETITVEETLNGRSYTTIKFPIILGRTFLLAGYTIDITERKESEQRIIDVTNYIQTLLRTSPVGIATFKESGEVVSINEAMARVAGTTLDNLKNLEHLNFRDLDSWKQSGLLESADRALATRTEQRSDFHILTSSGKQIDLDCLIVPFMYGGEQHLMLAAMDITERKLAEEMIKKSAYEFRMLAEAMPQIVWITDPAGQKIYFNQQWVEYTGLTLEESYGYGWNKTFHPDDRRRAMETWQEAITRGVTYTLECRLRRADGAYKWWLMRGVPILDEQGAISKWFGTYTDIDELKQVEDELLKAKAAADSANTAKSNFLATMSHEIRTPMNGVIGMIELLQHTELAPEQQEYAESAKRSGIELVHLLNDILDLSKIEADKLELELADFDLQPVVSDTLSLLSPAAREKGVALALSYEDDVPTALKGDSGRLRQIISNLVSNAFKFTSEGTVALRIRKDFEDDHTVTLRFLIADTGIGIAADKLELIFAPFTQADSSTTRRFGGTGLGLAICKRLAELMGGTIGVESTEGVGSTFWFTVVLEKQAPREVNRTSVASPGKRVLHTRPDGSKIRILLTEDDPKAQKIVPKLLKNYGYQVDVATSGKEALEALANNDYELVLMDCMMPEMNGYEVTSYIRDPASPVRRHDIPIIALTGNAMKQDRNQCVAAGMDDHLSKPLILDNLLAKLDEWLKA